MEIRTFRQSDPEYLLSLLLRYKILRIPLGLTFSAADLARDKADVHIGIFRGEEILATLTLTDSGRGSIQMRQVAVDDAEQGRGIGKALARYAEEYAKKEGFTIMHCHARAVAAPFYKALGYETIGAEFIEVGIKHYHMQKKLGAVL
ncbi:MAG: GNAT family N-acetyltransferase [Bacteroidetes bacterium]|nr:GNAT family N-acetyltransferase [Bacteroidota bacterium]MBS1684037.1 GNAT family N-acetyltransferase [Bacteroidota bacterium]